MADRRTCRPGCGHFEAEDALGSVPSFPADPAPQHWIQIEEDIPIKPPSMADRRTCRPGCGHFAAEDALGSVPSFPADPAPQHWIQIEVDIPIKPPSMADRRTCRPGCGHFAAENALGSVPSFPADPAPQHWIQIAEDIPIKPPMSSPYPPNPSPQRIQITEDSPIKPPMSSPYPPNPSPQRIQIPEDSPIKPPTSSPQPPNPSRFQIRKHRPIKPGMPSPYPPNPPSRLSIWIFLGIFLFLAGVTALTVWLVYRPHKPHFSLVGASIYNLTLSSPSFISTNIQLTIITHNPNSRVSIYYDRLSVYVSYYNQAITPAVELPPLFQERHSTVGMSPILGGDEDVPVSPDTTNGLVEDASDGVVTLRVVLSGELRWKAGVFRSKRYGIYVKCEALVGFKMGCSGQVPLLGPPGCSVDV